MPKVTSMLSKGNDNFFSIIIDRKCISNDGQLFEYTDETGEKIAEATYIKNSILISNFNSKKINLKIKLVDLKLDNIIIQNLDSNKKPSGNINLVVSRDCFINSYKITAKKLRILSISTIITKQLAYYTDEVIIDGDINADRVHIEAKNIILAATVCATETIFFKVEKLHVLATGKLLTLEASMREMRYYLENRNGAKNTSVEKNSALSKQSLFFKSIQFKELTSIVVEGEIFAGLLLDCHPSQDITIAVGGKLSSGVELNCFAEREVFA